MVKISTVKGKLPVSSIVFGREDLAPYGAAIDKLSSDDEASSQPRRTTKRRKRGSVSADGWAANPDSWAPNEKMDDSQFHAGKNLPPQLPARARARGQPNGSQHRETNSESRSSSIVVHHRWRREVSQAPVRHKRNRTARIEVSRRRIPDSGATSDERSHDDSASQLSAMTRRNEFLWSQSWGRSRSSGRSWGRGRSCSRRGTQVVGESWYLWMKSTDSQHER